MNVNHMPMSTFCKFQINQINREQDVPSFVTKPVDIHITLYTNQ